MLQEISFFRFFKVRSSIFFVQNVAKAALNLFLQGRSDSHYKDFLPFAGALVDICAVSTVQEQGPFLSTPRTHRASLLKIKTLIPNSCMPVDGNALGLV